MNATMPIGAELNFVQTLREDNRNRERQMQLTPVTAGFFRVRSTNRCIEDARQMKTPQKLFLSLVFEKELTILCLLYTSFADQLSLNVCIRIAAVFAVEIGFGDEVVISFFEAVPFDGESR